MCIRKVPKGQIYLIDLALDSKLRDCDLVSIMARDVFIGGRVASRSSVIQYKTQSPVQFEIAKQTR